MIPAEAVEACDITTNIHVGCAHMNVRPLMTVGRAPTPGHPSTPAIPEAAIEAAMRAWGVKGEDQRKIVGCILEAAAPHMLAEFRQQRAVDMDRADVHIYPAAKWLGRPTL